MRFVYLFLVFIVSLLVSPAHAKDMGSLISPGDLSSYHKEADGFTNCTKCHVIGSGITNAACENCHKEITAAVATKKGYHSSVSSQKCVECHTDHKGRAFKLVVWDPKKFDHTKAGYDLVGKHKDVNCEKCHKTKTKAGVNSYLGAQQACKSCHEDIHKGEFKEKLCENCHNTLGWKEKNVRFDHGKVYALDGKHIDVKCAKCHVVKGDFRVAEKEKCVTCHLKADKHKGQLGTACEKCHKTTSWKEILFDHSKAKYQLQAKHLQVACDKCHASSKTTGVFKVEKYDSCDAPGCHDKGKFGNVHKQQFTGQKCDKCHTVSGFKPSLYKHGGADYVGFKLLGKHSSVACEKCHAPDPITKVALFKPIQTASCDAAHCHDVKERGNIHGASQFNRRKCDECHNEQGWKPTLFKHDSIGFKLLGKHAQAKCEKCHIADPLTKIVKYRPIVTISCDWAGCHNVKERGYIHGAQFKGQKCETCHNEQGWKPTLFKHDAAGYAGFKLDGKHAQTACDKCHKPTGLNEAVLFKPIKYDSCTSAACHKNPHQEQFEGKKCEQCHTAKNWKDLTSFSHKTQARFPLEGKHVEAKCFKCHQSKVWRPLVMTCINCHAKDDIKAHKGKMGEKCEQCHTAQNWEPNSFFHEVTGFRLEGAHTQVTCGNCHKTKGIYSGLGPQCTKCHTDPHFNQFGPAACGDCHTAKNWFPERFRHGLTGFRLEGGHRVAACERCHKSRTYRNTTSQCIGCHQADFTSPQATPFHSGASTDCTLCHKVYTWLQATTASHRTMTFTGYHSVIKSTCASCHTGTAYALKWPGVTNESQCATCHATQAHGTCPTNCSLCHNTTAFKGAQSIVPCKPGPGKNGR